MERKEFGHYAVVSATTTTKIRMRLRHAFEPSDLKCLCCFLERLVGSVLKTVVGYFQKDFALELSRATARRKAARGTRKSVVLSGSV
jgi:hypothetical protein